jgi:hypothetical protein
MDTDRTAQTDDRSTADVFASLDRTRAEEAEAAVARRRQTAELAVLTAYDFVRVVTGHDYGAAQRRGELRRLEREVGQDGETVALVAAGVELPASMMRDLEPLTRDELATAWAKVARPKLRRLEREAFRSGTPATRRTLEAWHRTADRLGLEVDR